MQVHTKTPATVVPGSALLLFSCLPPRSPDVLREFVSATLAGRTSWPATPVQLPWLINSNQQGGPGPHVRERWTPRMESGRRRPSSTSFSIEATNRNATPNFYLGFLV